jgi:hypothetical protein
MSLRYPNSGVNAAYYNPVACLPGAPTIGTATATGTSVSLTFTAPGANGGNPITCYIATSNVGSFTGANTSSPVTISGLTKNTGYSFTVAARTATGTGASSSASNGILAQGVPNAPTIGTATISGTTASITFTAPTCNGGNAITSYTATSCPGSITGTGASSPISVSGLTGGTSYTFKVKATNGIGTGPCSSSSNSVTAQVIGSQSYITAGTYSWVAPAGVTSVSAVAVGGGGGAGCGFAGRGGALGYKNNYSVIPGNSYTVVVGNGGVGRYYGNGIYYNGCYVCSPPTAGGDSYFVSTSIVKGGGGPISGCNNSTSTYTGDGGGVGGKGHDNSAGLQKCAGGGGAGGYSGAGGNGGWTRSPFTCAYETYPTNGSGGGGAGGQRASQQNGTNNYYGAGGGGGVGLFGQGCNGVATTGKTSIGGGGGSGGAAGCNGQAIAGYGGPGGKGGSYGGGGGCGGYYYNCGSGIIHTGAGGSGAVRIVWPGTSRQFPSTNVGSP